MSGSKSDYLEAALLNLVLGGTAWTAPANVYVALSTATYSDTATGTSMTEVSTTSTGYARVLLTNNATNWPAASGTSPTTKANGTTITFPTASGSWGTVTSFYLVDAASAGNVLYGGDLSASKAIASGDTASFAATTGITITED
jgi:hypothetical protein